jgi:hypothetical protein
MRPLRDELIRALNGPQLDQADAKRHLLVAAKR